MSHPNIQSTPRGPNAPKLKQIGYRSYPHAITIYHFQAMYDSIASLRSSLLRAGNTGYVATLQSWDPVLRLRDPLPIDDEMQPGRVEVAYLPDVFHRGGSALGFRLRDGVVEWMCFEREIATTVLERGVRWRKSREDSMRLFDCVATLEKVLLQGVKMTYRVSEHRGWHHSLENAGYRPQRVRLTWVARDRDFLREQGGQEREVRVRVRRAGDGELEAPKSMEGGDGDEEEDMDPDEDVESDQDEESDESSDEDSSSDEDDDVRYVNTRSKAPQRRAYMSPPKSDTDKTYG